MALRNRSCPLITLLVVWGSLCWSSSFDGGQRSSLLVEAGAAVRKGEIPAGDVLVQACFCSLFPLQLNQNLNDVLVSLEKQQGSNTFTVKAQPRWVKAGRVRSVGPCD